MHDELIEHCERFRSLIVACDPETLFVTLQTFPHGACGDASLLLARYLAERGHGEFRYMLGERDNRSHAWLQRGSLIVDITADQFADCPLGPVYVGEDTGWHDVFAGEDLHVADYSIFDDHTKASLGASFARITGI
ncbi:hypothetical protein HA464_14330 [Rhizobium leguminosarum bv. trifolii]|uniref:hypothetical protein n=1 Tax=Rhizobium ruizarguesonis TaxID=2081791 RepID=UPI0013DB7F5C|nr:hypothetical protein [Rhizobium ruizarguesonis]NEH85300.1 hypothetical protein [Rhizobium ruizarguesonis]QIO45062.1 hypothetical protein HA464_14330 [Rhizobium leguminosarum bv. trifolii]